MKIDDDNPADPAVLAQLLMVEVTGRLEDLAAASVDLQTSNASADALSAGLRAVLVLLDARAALSSIAPIDPLNPEAHPP